MYAPTVNCRTMPSTMATSDITLEKTLPHSAEAERAVLGAILLDSSLFDQAASLLLMDDFHLPAHREIFSRMSGLSATSQSIDTLTLREALERNEKLAHIGGATYLSSLIEGVPRLSNLEQYARIVKDKSVRRKLIHSAHSILERGYSEQEASAELLDAAERSIFEISQERVDKSFVKLENLLPGAYQQIQAAYERKELITGIATGFIELDNLTSGLQPTELIIIAARPGLGKTSLALNIGQHATMVAGKTVGLFSLEMGAAQLVTRLLCSQARVDSHRVRSGRLSKEDWGELAKTMGSIDQASFFIDDTPGISILEMRSKARRLKAEHGLDLLIIDYMQLMSGKSGEQTRYESREKEISAISRSLKGLAKELEIPVVALSQLSRAPEQRKGAQMGRPQLSDLRESGSIEQDADVVVFIYREDMYKKEEDLEDESGVAQIIVAKQRNGPIGTIKLAFIDQWTKFENLAYD